MASVTIVTGVTVHSSRLAIANLPCAMLPENQVFVHEVLLERSVKLPVRDVKDVRAILVLLHMSSNVLHALIPARWAEEFAVAADNGTDALLWSVAKLQVTARLMILDVVFAHWVLLHVASTGALCGVHAAEMLGEKVFAVEVVVIEHRGIVRIGGGCAEVAAPEA